jgi:four helix bundle protein
MKEGNFRFIEWPVYQDAKKFAHLNIRLVHGLPKEYRFEIGSQIIRSSISVALNIAEGSGKNSDTDFAHFLNISRGSLFETIAALDILRDNKLVTEASFIQIADLGNTISNQLAGLRKKLIKR